MRVVEDISAAVGNTPMVRLARYGRHSCATLYGKCEFMNPGGSIKDRIGFHMVAKAEAVGHLRPGGTIVEATAGNTGMGLAMAAALRGYKMIATMTTKMSGEKVGLLRALGVQVEVCPYETPYGHAQHFMSRARSIAAAIPGAWYADQFSNADNVEAHYRGTGPEIWRQMEGNVDVLVGGMGTGGSLSGAGKYLRELKSSIEIVLADPEGSVLKAAWGGLPQVPRPYRVEGIGGDFVPSNCNLDLVSEVVQVSDASAIQAAVDLFRAEGIFVGASSGAILAAALRYAGEERNEGKRVVALLPDSGRAYLSTIYSESWRERYGIFLRSETEAFV